MRWRARVGGSYAAEADTARCAGPGYFWVRTPSQVRILLPVPIGTGMAEWAMAEAPDGVAGAERISGGAGRPGGRCQSRLVRMQA